MTEVCIAAQIMIDCETRFAPRDAAPFGACDGYSSTTLVACCSPDTTRFSRPVSTLPRPLSKYCDSNPKVSIRLSQTHRLQERRDGCRTSCCWRIVFHKCITKLEIYKAPCFPTSIAMPPSGGTAMTDQSSSSQQHAVTVQICRALKFLHHRLLLRSRINIL